MKKQAKGYANIAKGSSKKITGKLVGDKSTENEGTVQKATGQAQVALANLEDDIRNIKK